MPEANRIRVPDLESKKRRGEPIAMLTAYDYTMARLLDRAGIDVMLVGDSLGMVVLGYETTLPVTLDAMVHHTRAVSRGTAAGAGGGRHALSDFQVSVPEAVRNAGRLIQEGGAAAVKMEGGGAVVEVAARLVEVGIPVMGHLGLVPQSVHQLGGFRRQATLEEDAEQLLADAHALEAAGAFAVVLESIPAEVARGVTAELRIPTIGIGAGRTATGRCW
jgi:3-methyl-2-oxobutanoate hydroxymethyltransferase